MVKALVALTALMTAGSDASVAGDKICDSRRNKAALVVMDMQSNFTNYRDNQKLPNNVRKLKMMVGEQIELIKSAIKGNIPIIIF